MVRLTGQPDDVPPKDASGPDDMAGNSHRQLIGYIGLVMPVLIIVLAIGRDGEKAWRNLTSISAYYYTGANAAFVGMLVALALFLFTYRGYKQGLADRCVAIVAGGAALLVAFFPTEVPEGFTKLTWWHRWVGKVHFGAAIALFSMFAIFSLWLFRKTATKEGGMPRDKEWRNWIYLGCGVLIVVEMVWAGWNGYNSDPIFWQEAFALVAFSVSWLVKGYAHRTIARAARWLLGG
jgi:hypothetical protein